MSAICHEGMGEETNTAQDHARVLLFSYCTSVAVCFLVIFVWVVHFLDSNMHWFSQSVSVYIVQVHKRNYRIVSNYGPGIYFLGVHEECTTRGGVATLRNNSSTIHLSIDLHIFFTAFSNHSTECKFQN